MAGLLDIIRAWGPDTCHKLGQYDPVGERSRGQCAPTALCVQDLLGGEIYTCRIGRERHYYNVTRTGQSVDLTQAQYGYPRTIRDTHPVQRRQLLRHPDVRLRYEVLRQRAGITTGAVALA